MHLIELDHAQSQYLSNIRLFQEALSEYTPSTADMTVIIGDETSGSLSALAISYVNADEVKPAEKKTWIKALHAAAAQIHKNLGLPLNL